MFLTGIVLGFAIAAPVGPIGVLCIQQTLSRGLWFGLLAGLGAATADAFYGSVAAFGLTVVSDFLLNQAVILQLVGGVYLCYLGITTFNKPVATATDVSQTEQGGFQIYVTTFILTLTNPMTILSFSLLFAGAGLALASNSYQNAFQLVGGTFVGSALWWLLLSGGVNLFRQRFAQDGLKWVNRLAGVLIVGFGLLALGSLLFSL